MRLLRGVSILATLCVAAGGVATAAAGRATPGVTRNRIKIGVHAPTTGAVPLPSSTVEQGAEALWEWRKLKRKPINGRHVDVVVKNDNYNPSQAVAVCKEMVEDDRVFLLSGLLNPEGKDQIQSCARYAAKVNVPYVSLGTTTTGLRRLSNYFAFSMTWPAQSRLLADFFAHRLGARKEENGVVHFDTPNYTDSHAAFVNAMDRFGTEVAYDRAVSHGSGQTEAQLVIEELKAADVENVFVLVSPTWFLQLLKAADTQNYSATWTSIGMTISSHDSVVNTGCASGNRIDGAKSLTPLPAFVDRDEFDRTYSRAMRRLYDGQGDMISWLGWSASRQLARLLGRTGRNLTRRTFIRSTERAHRVRTGVMPALNFRPRDHFGANQTHVVTARCSDRKWHTTATFKRGF